MGLGTTGISQPVNSAAIVDGSVAGVDLSSTIAIPANATATTQSPANNSTKVATTAYADAAAAAGFSAASDQTITGTWSFSGHPVTGRSGGYFVVVGAAANSIGLNLQVSGDNNARTLVDATGTILWGGGTFGGDTNLYRSGVSQLKTDNTFIAVDGVATKTKAGTPSDADFTTTPPDGAMVADTSGNKLWVRVGGAWKFAALL